MKNQELIQKGFADYFELDEAGISKKINHGKNKFGLIERTIILNDGSQWEYIPEDNLYELKSN